jgi:hypothetical protein
MGWDRGRYYTRSRKVNGRVVREYIGSGRVGELVAELDALEREARQADRQALQDEREALRTLDAPVAELCALADLLAQAALLAAGYHQHNRGTWRKRRGSNSEAS